VPRIRMKAKGKAAGGLRNTYEFFRLTSHRSDAELHELLAASLSLWDSAEGRKHGDQIAEWCRQYHVAAPAWVTEAARKPNDAPRRALGGRKDLQ
jgi:hypothetical protein